ncbi:MAG TPA: SpoIID/LytB domain-containing protein [Acidimicrobiia bacterium]
MRNKWSGMAAASLLVVTLLAGPAGAAEGEWTVDGGGWGHGVGLSQYGAYGQAREGRSAEQILTFYYKGTSVSSASQILGSDHWIFRPDALWVGLREGDTRLQISAVGGPAQVCQPSDCSDPTKQFQISPGQEWIFESGSGEHQGQCRFRLPGVDNNGWGPCNADITWQDNGGGNRLVVAGTHYAHGRLRIRPAGDGKFHTILSIGLELYLRGLAEVPSSWPNAALDAQAIIGRGYAIATALARGGSDGSGRLSSCGCHIRDDTRDQAYSGWAKESEPTYGARWVAAVERTGNNGGHQVVTHPQAPNSGIISAYYSSSNGGVSENVEDVWGGPALPWLRSVEDPWSADPNINPLARWSVFLDGEVLRSRLCAAGSCWDAVTGGEVVKKPPAGRVRLFGLVGRQVVSTEVTAVWLYNVLNAYGTEPAPGGGRRAARVSPYIVDIHAPSPFRDVGNTVHFDDIVYIASIGVTKGCNPPDNNLFCPTRPVTRQQMASFLVRALDLPRTDQDFFVDDNGSVHEADINALAAAGITRGCNPPANDRFCPQESVSRAQMAAFLVRGYGYTDPGEGNLFTDDNGSVFEGDIDRLATAGVTKGCNPPANDRFCPTQPVTREQMASFLARAIRR